MFFNLKAEFNFFIHSKCFLGMIKKYHPLVFGLKTRFFGLHRAIHASFVEKQRLYKNVKRCAAKNN